MTVQVVRATMQDLIDYARRKIGDTPGGCQEFQDYEVQAALDDRREFVRYEVLFPKVKFTTSNFQYLDYTSRRKYWEKGEELLGPRYQTITPASVDYIGGHWIFAAGTGTGQYPPVFLAGYSYDLYGACADLLDSWVAVLARKYDFTTGGASFHRSQQATALAALAAQYRRKALVKQVRLIRDDVDPNGMQENGDRRALIGPASYGVPFITGD